MTIRPETISVFKKLRFLKEMSEDDFRDRVVRPIFFRRGLKDGRDLCGASEEGKDAYFLDENKFGLTDIYVVQTKKGNLNLSAKTSENVITAATQLKTALETKITLTNRQKTYPSFAILCASGKINKKARDHIADEVRDSRIRFLDADDLIPTIDSLYPELWYGIDAQKIPYLNKLREALSSSNEKVALAEISVNDLKLSAATDEVYVPLKLYFIADRIRKTAGKIIREPKLTSIPIEALIGEEPGRYLILGEAGAGKSTALKRIAYVICEQSISEERKILLPILLRAIDIKEKNIKLLDLCVSESEKISGGCCFSADDLQEGRVLLLIDALDELANDFETNQVLDLIEQFIAAYPNCKIILTSREYKFLKSYSQLSKYKDFRLTNIDLEQAKKMVAKLIKGKTLPSDVVQEIVRKLQNVHGIELNPLLITVFVAGSDFSRKDIPANITELFKKYTELMLGRWDTSKGLGLQYQSTLKDHLLQKLAFEMHRQKVTSISADDCKNILNHEMELIGRKDAEIELLVNEIIFRSGLFRHLDDRIEFRHLLLQEFFAGRGIPNVDLIPTLILEPWWQKAIIFYFGQNPGDLSSLEAIVKKVNPLNPDERFFTAVTIGLSIQACYLVPLTPKAELLKWVLKSIAFLKDLLTPVSDESAKLPLTKFIHYYLYGRDAVACDVIESSIQKFEEDLKTEAKDDRERETVKFWLIVGLLECGQIEQAQKMVRAFSPRDERLLLALHLGAFLIAHLKIMNASQRASANAICDYLAPSIKHLRLKFLEEFKSELVELQKGQVRAIELKPQH